MELSEIAIYISLAGLGISAIAILSYILSRRNFKSDAMLSLFKIISDSDVKIAKKTLADEYWRCDKNNEVPNFRNFKSETFKVMEAYNQACALYELNLIDKKHFRKVYGGNIVRTFNLTEKHIVSWIVNNSDYCIHFRNVTDELITKYKIKGELYRDIDS